MAKPKPCACEMAPKCAQRDECPHAKPHAETIHCFGWCGGAYVQCLELRGTLPAPKVV